eukprot:gene9172-biopygen9175
MQRIAEAGFRMCPRAGVDGDRIARGFVGGEGDGLRETSSVGMGWREASSVAQREDRSLANALSSRKAKVLGLKCYAIVCTLGGGKKDRGEEFVGLGLCSYKGT